MGGAVIKRWSSQDDKSDIADFETFKELADEYDKLKSCGLTLEGCEG